jgi:uncharacterized protein YjbI with pentapeptide repeats
MLASRLGVAALIIIALSVFTSNRPLISISLSDDVPSEAVEEMPTVTLGPLTIMRDESAPGEDKVIIRHNLDALREARIIDEASIDAIAAELDRAREALDQQKADRERTDDGEHQFELEALKREAQELGLAGLEIAQQFVSLETQNSDNTAPDRLSEDELQSLVVQRLLSVQSQIREDEDPASTSERSAQSTSSSRAASQSAPRGVPPNLGEWEVQTTVTGRAPPISTVRPAYPLKPMAPVLSPTQKGHSPTNRVLPRVAGDFSGKNLMGTDFRNKDLSGLDFSNARLTAAKFDGSDLTGANFSGAKIHGASFANAIMNEANLTNAQAQTAHFEHASMVNTVLDYANFAGAVLTDADLRGASMTSLNLNGADLEGALIDETP